MKCSSSSELMVDVLYGEEIDSRTAFEFFKHLSTCSDCEADYFELLETRELLGQWDEPVSEEIVDKSTIVPRIRKKISWLPLVQRIAAGILIFIGIFAMLQYVGVIPQQNHRAITVSDEQLALMIHDVLVARQVEDWRVIGTALLGLKEEIEMQNRLGIESVYQDIDHLRHRYVLALEENNRHVQKLLNQ